MFTDHSCHFCDSKAAIKTVILIYKIMNPRGIMIEKSQCLFFLGNGIFILKSLKSFSQDKRSKECICINIGWALWMSIKT